MSAKKFGDELIAKLRRTTADLEEFQVQLALGKAEAHDKYEELKKKFNRTLHTVKTKAGTTGRKKAEDLVADIEELQVQLALGKAETKDAFETQRKKIMRAINRLESTLMAKAGAAEVEANEKLNHDMHAFRIKLEMLRLQYELGKLEAKDKFEERKHRLDEKLANLKSRLNSRPLSSKNRKEELKDAYKHLKKAFAG